MNVYFDNLIGDVKKYKFFLIGLVVVCAVAGGGYGFISARKASALSEAEMQEISSYNEKLENYRAAVQDAKTALQEQEIMVRELQEYNDNSILMKIDPQSVNYVTIQFAIDYAEGVSAGNVNQSILAYIKDGGLRESVEDKEALETKYWGEVLSAGVSGNVLNITLIHYDAEKGKAIIETVKKKLLEKVPEIAAMQGDFLLKEQETSLIEKSEVALINTQNSNHNNLRSYLTTKADLENRVTGSLSGLESFESENRPAMLDQKPIDVRRNVIKYVLVGIIGGIALFILLAIARTLFGSGVSSKDDIEKAGLTVLSLHRNREFSPELTRASMEVSLYLKKNGVGGVHIQVLSKDVKDSEIVREIMEDFEKNGILCTCGTGLFDSADCLKEAISQGCCVPVIMSGKDKVDDVRSAADCCNRFGIQIPGCILVQ